MEMDNFLSNTQIGKILSNLLNLIKENYKFVLYSTAGFLFISLIYSFSLSPKYQIIADVKLKDESGNASLPSSSSVLSLITGGGAGNISGIFIILFFQLKLQRNYGRKDTIRKFFLQTSIQNLRHSKEIQNYGMLLNHGSLDMI